MIAIISEEEAGHATYYTGMMLVSMASYTFFGLRLFYALVVNTLLIIGYEIVAIYWHHNLASEQGILIFVSSNFFSSLQTSLESLPAFFLNYITERTFIKDGLLKLNKAKHRHCYITYYLLKLRAF
jgi:hypothetical protein